MRRERTETRRINLAAADPATTARRRLIDEGLGVAYAETELDLFAALERTYARRPVWNHETAQWVMMVPATGDIRTWVRN